jgi:hypothetical protein
VSKGRTGHNGFSRRGQGKKPGPNRIRTGLSRYPRGGAGLPGSNKGYPLADSGSARCSGESVLIVATMPLARKPDW